MAKDAVRLDESRFLEPVGRARIVSFSPINLLRLSTPSDSPARLAARVSLLSKTLGTTPDRGA
jgi:hypothetical protein